MKDQLNLFDGVKERDLKLDQVADRSRYFMKHAYLEIVRLSSGEYTGEDIRLLLSRRLIVPHHPNAWGSLIMKAVKDGVLEPTGRLAKMKVKSSHARKTAIYLKK